MHLLGRMTLEKMLRAKLTVYELDDYDEEEDT